MTLTSTPRLIQGFVDWRLVVIFYLMGYSTVQVSMGDKVMATPPCLVCMENL